MGEPGPDGRRVPVEIPDSVYEIPTDQVLLGTGQLPDTGWVESGLRDGLSQRLLGSFPILGSSKIS